MDKSSIPILVLFLVFLIVQVRTNSHRLPKRPVGPRQICASEFAVASHACAFLPYDPGHLPSSQLLARGDDEHEHEHKHEHEDEDEDDDDDEDEHRHRHRHGHRHRRHHHWATPLEEECCRWLQSIDNGCVCSLLVRLPPFLSRPIHEYTVTVRDSCNVTFQCGSRISS